MSAPDYFTESQRQAYEHIKAYTLRADLWDSIIEFAIEHFAAAAGQYIDNLKSIRAGESDPEFLKEHRELRMLIRKYMADFYVIDESAVNVVAVDDQGIDEDIARFFHL